MSANVAEVRVAGNPLPTIQTLNLNSPRYFALIHFPATPSGLGSLVNFTNISATPSISLSKSLELLPHPTAPCSREQPLDVNIDQGIEDAVQNHLTAGPSISAMHGAHKPVPLVAQASGSEGVLPAESSADALRVFIQPIAFLLAGQPCETFAEWVIG